MGAEEATLRPLSPQFVGSVGCKSSYCHGGGAGKNQYQIWLRDDFHAKAAAILSTARSKQIAQALNLPSAEESASCTTCHSPFAALKKEQPARLAAPSEHIDTGVSCESCHGAASEWLRTHTRPDLTRAQRVAVGVRDLENLYVRANTCVACHETLPAELVRAGHPELSFELDRQARAQPPHWPMEGAWAGPKSWLTGQAVALREQSWKLASASGEGSLPRWKGLVWVLRQAAVQVDGSDAISEPPIEPAIADFSRMQRAADQYAKGAAKTGWDRAKALAVVKRLTATGDTFAAEGADIFQRVEALVLGLSSLMHALQNDGGVPAGAVEALAALQEEVREPSLFSSRDFAQRLEAFSRLFPELAS